MVFPYENFHWAEINLAPRYGSHRYRVIVHPNMAKVIDVTTSQTINIFEGEDREALAVADATTRMEYWDKHIYCCWQPKRKEPEVVIRERRRTRRS